MTPAAIIPVGSHRRIGSDPASVGQTRDGRGVDTPGLDAGQGGAVHGNGADGGLEGRCSSAPRPEELPASLDRLMYRHSTPSPHRMSEFSADGSGVVHGDSSSTPSPGVGGGSSCGYHSEEWPPARLSRLMPPCCTPSPHATGDVSHGEPVVVQGGAPPASGFGVEDSTFAEGGVMGGLAAPVMLAMEQAGLLLKRLSDYAFTDFSCMIQEYDCVFQSAFVMGVVLFLFSRAPTKASAWWLGYLVPVVVRVGSCET